MSGMAKDVGDGVVEGRDMDRRRSRSTSAAARAIASSPGARKGVLPSATSRVRWASGDGGVAVTVEEDPEDDEGIDGWRVTIAVVFAFFGGGGFAFGSTGCFLGRPILINPFARSCAFWAMAASSASVRICNDRRHYKGQTSLNQPGCSIRYHSPFSAYPSSSLSGYRLRRTSSAAWAVDGPLA